MCSRRGTPEARHAATRFRASSTCARANVSLPGFVQDADEVDDGVGAAHERGEPRGVVDVGLDDVDGRQQDQVARALAAARRHDEVVPVGGEPRARARCRRSRCRRARRCAAPARPSLLRGERQRDGRGERSRCRAARRDRCRGAAARRPDGVARRARVVDRVGEHLLHVVARLVERDRLDPDRAFERLGGRHACARPGPALYAAAASADRAVEPVEPVLEVERAELRVDVEVVDARGRVVGAPGAASRPSARSPASAASARSRPPTTRSSGMKRDSWRAMPRSSRFVDGVVARGRRELRRDTASGSAARSRGARACGSPVLIDRSFMPCAARVDRRLVERVVVEAAHDRRATRAASRRACRAAASLTRAAHVVARGEARLPRGVRRDRRRSAGRRTCRAPRRRAARSSRARRRAPHRSRAPRRRGPSPRARGRASSATPPRRRSRAAARRSRRVTSRQACARSAARTRQACCPAVIGLGQRLAPRVVRPGASCRAAWYASRALPQARSVGRQPVAPLEPRGARGVRESCARALERVERELAPVAVLPSELALRELRGRLRVDALELARVDALGGRQVGGDRLREPHVAGLAARAGSAPSGRRARSRLARSARRTPARMRPASPGR